MEDSALVEAEVAEKVGPPLTATEVAATEEEPVLVVVKTMDVVVVIVAIKAALVLLEAETPVAWAEDSALEEAEVVGKVEPPPTVTEEVAATGEEPAMAVVKTMDVVVAIVAEAETMEG